MPPARWPHQEAALARAARDGVCLLDMRMGSGKSRVAVDFCCGLAQAKGKQRVLILAPAQVVPVWPTQFERWATERYAISHPARWPKSWPAKKLRDAYQRTHEASDHYDAPLHVWVMSYDAARTKAFRTWLLDKMWDAVLCDESHRIKAHNSKTSMLIAKIGMRTPNRICMTGTPYPHSPLDAFGQARFLNPQLFGTQWALFRNRYAVIGVAVDPTWPDEWKRKLLGLDPEKRAHAVQLLQTHKFKRESRYHMKILIERWLRGEGAAPGPRQWAMLGRIDTERLQRVVAWQNLDELESKMATITYHAAPDLGLPPVHSVDVPVELSPATERVYREMEDEFVAWLNENEFITAANAADRLGKLQQATAGFFYDEDHRARVVGQEKEDVLVERLEDLPGDEPVICCGQFQAEMDLIHRAAERAGRACEEISGRRNDVGGAVWQPTRPGTVLAVQIAAGGLGLDFTVANQVFILSCGFNLGNYDQFLARTHRPGQDRPVTYYHLIAEGTVDRRVYSCLRRRRNLVEGVVAGIKEKLDGASTQT